jgi:hypothetical protein
VPLGLWGAAGSGTLQPVFARVHKGVAQTVPNTTDTSITYGALDVEDNDAFSMHNPASNPERLTIPVAGIYLATAGVQWSNTSQAGARGLVIATGSGFFLGRVRYAASPGASQWTWQVTFGMAALAAADFVYSQAWQSSGGNLDIDAVTASFFSIVKLGDT